MTTTKKQIQWLAWFGMIVGLASSIAANVAHAWLVGDPGTGRTLMAVAPPLFFYLGVEFVCRHRIDMGWATWPVFGPIVLSTFGASYWAIWKLAAAYGQPPLIALTTPLMIDGIMAASTIVLTTTRTRRADKPKRVDRAADIKADKPKDTPPIVSAGKPAAWDRALAAQLLTDSKMTHAEIATRIGVSTKTIQRYATDLKASKS